ncbi:hypothetical protein EVAR_39358_1 [Eumeta japonica]|uniref:Bud22 domain-containing protein n=1 Tax=Eumeta variegata TaxID=151549 RepID=A0A4C1WPN5_EUMVA|nr:hypothetical protein EVAR_39358_1 [Eumeta japonica]
MSRQERLKSKKEAKESQNKKNKVEDLDCDQNTHNENKTISTRDDWKVDDVAMENISMKERNNHILYSLDDNADIETDSGESIEESVDGNDSELDFDVNTNALHEEELNKNDNVIIYDESNNMSKTFDNIDVKTKKFSDVKNNNVKKSCTKNKKVSDKFQQKRSNINSQPIQENKVVDPFFITSTGENYMSLVEPRPPDEVKEVYKQGNRKLRRAIMFGHVPRFKRKDQNLSQNDPHQKNSTRSNYTKFNKPEEERKNRKFTNPSNRDSSINEKNADKPPEKLHPSWEAKKRLSSIQPFQGIKIVFD